MKTKQNLSARFVVGMQANRVMVLYLNSAECGLPSMSDPGLFARHDQHYMKRVLDCLSCLLEPREKNFNSMHSYPPALMLCVLKGPV